MINLAKPAISTRKLKLFFLLTFSFLLCSCSKKASAQQKFGVDAEYFVGLKLLEQGQINEARSKFKRCSKKGSYYCARKSEETLCTIGSLQEKNQAVLNLHKKYNDSDSLLLAVKHFSEAKDLHKILELTKNIDYTTEYNETIKIRLEAMRNLGSSNYEEVLYKWYTSRPITDFHYKYWKEILVEDFPDFSGYWDGFEVISPDKFIINYRVQVYRRDYPYGLRAANKILGYMENDTVPVNAQLASDIGKSYLYGSSQFSKNGLKFKEYAKNFINTPAEFYFWFYAGRYFDKAVNYYSQAKKCFENAMEVAENNQQKDNALWYLLSTSLNYSVDSIINSIGTYSRQWTDPEYFEDFFESLVSSLLAGGKWDEFYKIYTELDGYASDETVAAYAYIYGRLLQEGLANPPKNMQKEEAIKQSFERACKSGSFAYYKILAAYALDCSATDIENLLCKKNKSSDTEKINTAAETLLQGYAYFGYPEYIYPAFLELNKTGLSTDTYVKLADFLRKCGNENNNYYTQSLRIAARGIADGNRDFSKEEMKLLYPNNYDTYVDTYCKKYDMNKSVMFALIRSESFFDADVVSSAGAIGLTQIMDFTGADIAQRLRKKEFSLLDAETNIEFGVYYLNHLYKRCDKSYLEAFSAYNAGLSKVRRWMQGTMIGFGKKKDMPMDIFLETMPYTETREYGRKLISASVMYEWLYNTQDASKDAFKNMVEKLIK